MINRLKALAANNRAYVHYWGDAPPYRNRVLTICLWWDDDHYRYFYLDVPPRYRAWLNETINDINL